MTGNKVSASAVLGGGLLLGAAAANAGGKYAIDDTHWISVGAAARGVFSAAEDGGDWSRDLRLDSARLYFNAQVHEYVRFELNTECVFCGNSALEDFHLLDAIVKLEFNPHFNVWAGRLLLPAERQELNGPYFSSTFDAYKTPFVSSDFSVKFGAGGAGVYQRDHGVNIWGAAGPGGALQYVFGVFNGLESTAGRGPNQDGNLLYAGRVAYNFLSVEKNPGYYTSGTYYGTGGDILTAGVAFQYQEDGTGSLRNPGDYRALVADLLFEKALPGKGVVTLNGEYKHFDSGYDTAAFADADCFCQFDGDAFSVAGLYLLPQTVGIGRLQPYVRYSAIRPDSSASRDEFEAGVNYVIDGHNARASLFWQHGDIASKGLTNFAPNAAGNDVDVIKLALQLQL